MHREPFSPSDEPSRTSHGRTERIGPAPDRSARGDGMVDVPIEATETMPHVPVQPGPAGSAGTEEINLPFGMALLIVSHGPNIGARFLLDRDVVVAGRHPVSEIFLADVTVSRTHVEFRRDDAVFTLVDAGSLNGTYVNRERVPMAELRAGDEIQIGKFRLTFVISETR